MAGLPYETLRAALAAQPLFEAKSWQLSPEAWPLTAAEVAELEAIGVACLEFHQAIETLYLRSAAGKNLLRNKPLLAPWVAEYFDRGKPADLVAQAREPRSRGLFPPVLRPDLLLTDTGFAMTELDSVPGGIGLTAFLNRLYGGTGEPVLGAGDAMIDRFHAALAALRPGVSNPAIALVVSEEAATYRPEMEWIARELQAKGKRVHCLRPEELFPLGGAVFFDAEGNPEKIEVVYRFFELFDLPQIPAAAFIREAWEAGEVAVAPPIKHYQEEKLALALFHHHRLQEFWAETMSAGTLKRLRALIPPSWVMDPAPLPPGAVLDGPRAAGRGLGDWRDLEAASQKERDLIIKVSGFHETAWGARSVTLGRDSSREEWQAAVRHAVEDGARHLYVLQTYQKPKRLRHPVYAAKDGSPMEPVEKQGRLRLCPYYMVTGGQAKLSGALATFCPPDKKIIHGMQDAALLPCRIL